MASLATRVAAVASFVAVAAGADECITNANRNLCDLAGQLCVDPNVNQANDWTCTCPEYLGFDKAQTPKVAGAATCTRVGACAGTNVCAQAGQGCRNNPDGTFSCLCNPPHSCHGAGAAALPATITLDECAAACVTCADTGSGNVCTKVGQECNDPNPTKASLSDWECLCLYPSATKLAGGPATCAYPVPNDKSNCINANACNNVAAGAVQSGCFDYSPLLVDPNAYTCKCTGAYAGSASKKGGFTPCDVIDECGEVCPTCADVGGGNLCAKYGQLCEDPNKAATSLRDWRCLCQGFAGTAATGAQGPATCQVTGACANVHCGNDQYCLNDGVGYKCVCVAPYTGERIGGSASCEIDECIADCPSCARDTCSAVGQNCVDNDKTARGTWSCVCANNPATTAALKPATCTYVDGCLTNGQTCFASNQDCANIAGGAEYFCECLDPTVGEPKRNEAAVCERDECVPNGGPFSICKSAGQTCVDQRRTVSGDWMCVCTNGKGGARVKAPADCTYDECVQICDTCARQPGPDTRNICNKVGQSCKDPNTRDYSLRDWVCECAGQATQKGNTTAMQPVECVFPAGSECNVFQQFCGGASQTCTDPNVNRADDWTCKCLTSNANGVNSLADCTYDECTNLENKGICDAAGQDCVDLNTKETSLGDWWCQCKPNQGYGMAERSPAPCLLQGCVANWEVCAAKKAQCEPVANKPESFKCVCHGGVPINPATEYPAGSECTASVGTCNGQTAPPAPTMPNQGCRDPNAMAANDWECACLTPFTGQASQAVATCRLDECTAECKGCANEGAGNICSAVGQLCNDDDHTTRYDWYCSCNAAGGKGQGKGAKGNWAVDRRVILKDKIAQCVLNECDTNAATCTAATPAQTCSDPNTDPAVKGDWICVCPQNSGSNIAAVANCEDIDECGPSNTVCKDAGQTCTDQNVKRTQLGDWTCSCVGATGTKVAGVATCTYPPGSECNIVANAQVCSKVGQSCVDDKTTTPDDWYCGCVPGTKMVGAPVLKGVAQCVVVMVDECLDTAKAAVCTAANQVCKDLSLTRMNSWVCQCPAGGNRAAMAATTGCTAMVSECTDTCDTCENNVCGVQPCVDPSPTVGSDWFCRCPAPSTAQAVGGLCHDECASGPGSATCVAGLQGCLDPNPFTADEFKNDWRCACAFAVNVWAVGKVAVCDECLADPAPCGAGQICLDNTKIDTAANVKDFVCSCPAPDTTSAVGKPAPCNDECKADPCGDDQTCLDTDNTLLGNFVCTCKNGLTGPPGQPADCNDCRLNLCPADQTCNDPDTSSDSTGDFVCTCTNGATKVGARAICIRNECEDVPPVCSGQTCTDPDINIINNYICTCVSDNAAENSKTMIGRPVSPCATYVNECERCFVPATQDACPCGNWPVGHTNRQICKDNNTHIHSNFDFYCTCAGDNADNDTLVTWGAQVQNCVAPPTPAPEVPRPRSPKRWMFRFQSAVAKDFALAQMLWAIVRTVNLDAAGQYDAKYVTCTGCRILTRGYIYSHCWAWDNSCKSTVEYMLDTQLNPPVNATFARSADVLQGAQPATGVFEFVGENDFVSQKWIEALQDEANVAEMRRNPNILLVGPVEGGDIVAAPDSDDSSGLKWWAILLIILGILCCLLLLFLLWWTQFRKSDKEKEKEKETAAADGENPNDGDEMMHPENDAAARHSSHGGSDGWNNNADAAFAAGGAGAAGGALGAAAAGRRGSQYYDGNDRSGVNPINSVFPKQTEVIGFGRNLEGQLGIGDAEDLKTQFSPVEVPDLHGLGINMIVCGSYHSVVVLTDATVLAFGEGSNGQLGLGNRLSPKVPTQVSFFKGKVPKAVACGEDHTVVVCTDAVYTFGSGEDGQLGLGDNEDRLIPSPVPGLSGQGVTAVACGSHHTAVVSNGSLFTFGWNKHGQLGSGDDADRNAPTEVAFFHGKQVQDVSCGVQHTVVLCSDGLYVMGGNEFGQLGLGHQEDQHVPQQVSFFNGRAVTGVSAWFHTMVSCEDGVYAFGEGAHKKLGVDPYGGYNDADAPNVDTPQPVVGFGDKDVLQVLAGSEHSVVHCADGIYIWGNGDGGKLGFGNTGNQPVPLQAHLTSLQRYIPRIVATGLHHTLIYATPR